MRAVFSLLFLLCLSGLAHAEELENFPGWSISKIPQEAAEDGSYQMRPDFFSLTPPDGKPAVSIDARTASALRSGQSNPLDVYAKKTSPAAEGEGEQYVYGASSNGYVQSGAGESSASSGSASASATGQVESGVVSAPTTSYQSSSAPGAFASASAPMKSSAGAALPPAAATSSSRAPASSIAAQANDIAASVAAAQTPASQVASANAAPVKPGAVEKTEADRNFSSAVSGAAAKGVSVSSGKSAESDEVAKVSDGGTGFGVAANSTAQGMGFKKTKDSKRSTASGSESADADRPADKAYDKPEEVPPCEGLEKTFSTPGQYKLKVPRGCTLLTAAAWGGGGGSGEHTSGGGAAFANGAGKFDGKKYDVIVVVGAAGGDASGSKAGLGGYPGGGAGGSSSNAPGGGGGGYSGVFLVEKSGGDSINAGKALVIAGGGGGGSGGSNGHRWNSEGARGKNGDAGGTQAGGPKGNGEDGSSLKGGDGGNGYDYPNCSRSQQSSVDSCTIVEDNGGEHGGGSQRQVPRDYLSVGGGGGGAGMKGGGGGSGAAAQGQASGGGGGSSMSKMENTIVEGGNGVNVGFHHYPDRGDAGSPGRHGKVIFSYY